MKRRSKLLLMYGTLLFGVLMIINFLCWLCLLFIDSHTVADEKYKLPNYIDKDLAKSIFEEDSHLNTSTEYTPFTEWKFKKFSGKTVKVDSLGYRYTNNNFANTENECYFFGGSTMWGVGSTDAQTIPSIWGQLNKKSKVYNYGVKAYNARQNLESLTNLILEGKKVDMAVFYIGVNEVFLCKNSISRHGHLFEELYRKRIANYEDDINRPLISQILWKYSKSFFSRFFYRIFTSSEQKQNDIAVYGYNLEKTKVASIQLLKTLEIAHTLVEKQGGKFIAILQPVAFIGNPQVAHIDLTKNEPLFKETYIELYRNIKTLMNEKKYNWLYDFTNSFDGKDYIYVDWCHISPNGNQIIATKVDSLTKINRE